MGNLDYTQVLNKIENTRRFGNEPGVVVTAQVIKVLREKRKAKAHNTVYPCGRHQWKGLGVRFFFQYIKKRAYEGRHVCITASGIF